VSGNARYLLTCIDHFTRWPEALPLCGHVSSHINTITLISQWIARFEVPDVITTDQGRQFESDLLKSLASTFGIHHIRTSLYHPQSNGLVERLRRTLKVALTAYESPQWSQQFPIVLLSLRSTVKQGIDAAPAELIYDTTLHLPGKLFHSPLPNLHLMISSPLFEN